MTKAKIDLKIDAESNKNENICSKCKKGKLVVELIRVGWKGRKTAFTSFCPVCGNTIKKIV